MVATINKVRKGSYLGISGPVLIVGFCVEVVGVGDEVGPELGIVTEIGKIIGLLSWLNASML